VIVVSDTSPLRYLVAIGGIDWLPVLFGEVICPPEVIGECLHPAAPAELRHWASSRPAWLRVVAEEAGSLPLPDGPALDRGEDAALRLARDLPAELVLIDERKGRAVAARLGLAITGTVGVLVEASLRGLADFDVAIQLLKDGTNFRIEDDVLTLARRRVLTGKL
jgi:predicted nucleic acid-binding protein